MSIYMQIQGINGEVTATNYQNWIELESLGFKTWCNMNTAFGKTTGREGALPNFGEINVKTRLNSTTPPLFTKFATRESIPQVVIDLTRNDSEPTPHFRLTLSNVMLSSININSDPAMTQHTPNANHFPLKELALNYTQIEVKAYPTDSQNKTSSAVATSVNLETGTVS